MTGPGRPPTGERVETRYPADVLAALDRLAVRDGITRAELLRRIAAEAVNAKRPRAEARGRDETVK